MVSSLFLLRRYHRPQRHDPRRTTSGGKPMSGQSKATISRITSYDTERNPYYRPELRTIQAIAQALELTLEQRRELFYTAFPEFYVWDEAAEHGYTVDETNDLLHGRGLPLLTSDK